MSGKGKSLADTQGNIGNYFSVNKNGTYLGNKGKSTGKGTSSNSPSNDSKALTPTTKQKTGPKNLYSAKRPRTTSNSPTEQRKRMNNDSSQATQQNKKMNNPNNKTTTDNTTPSSLGQHGFAELEKRLLAGFEVMIQRKIEPLKNDIKEMKLDQSRSAYTTSLENNVTLSRKFEQKEEKHRKLQERISYVEDQLLEKNIIFQGIYETEFKEYKDVKTQVVKAIAETMNGETEEEKKQSAKNTSIDSIERMGRFNPLRTQPVKVKFTEKKDVDNLFKNRKKLPKGIFIDKEYSKSTEKERRTLRPIIKAARRMTNLKGFVRWKVLTLS